MKSSSPGRLAIGVSILLGSFALYAVAATGGYHLLKKYPFGAVEDSTREYFDFLTVDSSARRVYLTHGTEVKVIDADDGALIGNVTGLKHNHGLALANEFGRGFITDDGQVIIFDLKTLKVIGKAKAGSDADGVIYDATSKRVFAMNGDNNSTTVIDAKNGIVVGTIDMGGHPEFAVADGKGTVYDNIGDKNEVVAIDSRTLKIKSRWPVVPSCTPTALAMDREHRRLFIGGRGPKLLEVMDADNGRVIQTFPIADRVDTNVYEPETGLIFSSTRDGTIHIFHEDSPDKFSMAETVKTEFGAKTMGLDTKTHNLFLDTADFGPAPALSPSRPQPNPVAIPGTFRVLVYGR
jgi:YVTN family beta-propeller protein